MSLTDEILMAIAQIAVALIGFSGVVVALGRRGNAWTESELLQLRTLVEPSIVVLAALFAPFAISNECDSGLQMLFRLARPAIFALDSETGHRLAIKGLKALPTRGGRSSLAQPGATAVEVAGLRFPNPVGVADVTTFTTHKTLTGPRGACVLTTDSRLARRIDRAVFPGRLRPSE